jgi:hypothetical protein
MTLLRALGLALLIWLLAVLVTGILTGGSLHKLLH